MDLSRALALILAVSVVPALASAGCNGLPDVLPGWDGTKWCNKSHTTPKYVVGRIIANYDHTPAGLTAALPEIASRYPGTKSLGGKGDKVHIPCVGDIDLITAAGEGGKGWQWIVDKDECNSCSPNICESGKAQNPNDPGSVTGGCRVKLPNEFATVQQVAEEDKDRFEHNCQDRDGARGWDFLDAVVDRLREKDKRWGYNCKRGNCSDPSKDVVAYYCGSGGTAEGALPVFVVDIISDHCGNSKPSWADVSNGGATSGAGWTTRGRFPAQQAVPEQVNNVMNTVNAANATIANASKTTPGASGTKTTKTAPAGAPSGGTARPKLQKQAPPSLSTQHDIEPGSGGGEDGGVNGLQDYSNGNGNQ